ncbi:MAG: hypothetical protein M0P64_00050 [Candidatus Pacebacteria bacterium]|jgi:plastocyanin|nr:hypothetical protein [Candidatus Paceibacterota bacterium]
MNKSASIVLSVVAVMVIVGGWFLYSTKDAAAPSTYQETQSTQTSTTTKRASVLVTYSASGFSPKMITVKQGDTVTFNSVDGSRMWVAVNEHPTHLGYDGTSRSEHCPDTAGTAFDQCAAGETFSFTFRKVGSFIYHNHTNANNEGTVVVTE